MALVGFKGRLRLEVDNENFAPGGRLGGWMKRIQTWFKELLSAIQKLFGPLQNGIDEKLFFLRY